MEKETVKSTEPKNTIVKALQDKAKSDKTFQSVCTAFAIRERARSQVSVQSLTQTMVAHGYKDFTKEDATKVIGFLANQKLGTLYKDTKGKIRALVNVKYTLQSIGQVALGDSPEVKVFRQQKHYRALPGAAAPKVVEVAAAPTKKATTVPFTGKIIGDINGKVLELPLTETEFKTFLVDFLSKKQ